MNNKKTSQHKISLQTSEQLLLKLLMISDALRVFMKNMKNIHGGVLLLIKSLASTCNSTNNNTPTRVIFTFSNCIPTCKGWAIKNLSLLNSRKVNTTK